MPKRKQRDLPGRRGKTSARTIEGQRLEGEALDLRIKGYSYREIAAEQGCSKPTAFQRVANVMEGVASLQKDKAELYRDLECARLDVAQRAIWADVELGDRQAIETFVKISARRAKLLGLDAAIELRNEVTIKAAQDLAQDLRASGIDLDALVALMEGEPSTPPLH